MDEKGEPVGDQQRGTLRGILIALGSFRDGFIVLGGVAYALGYLTWTISAWKRGLGTLPALDSQYFTTGIIPTALLCLTYLGMYRFYTIVQKLSKFFAD
jgi:hypothetical protein